MNGSREGKRRPLWLPSGLSAQSAPRSTCGNAELYPCHQAMDDTRRGPSVSVRHRPPPSTASMPDNPGQPSATVRERPLASASVWLPLRLPA